MTDTQLFLGHGSALQAPFGEKSIFDLQSLGGKLPSWWLSERFQRSQLTTTFSDDYQFISTIHHKISNLHFVTFLVAMNVYG